MKPKKLYVKNFLGLREIDLEFVDGITVIEGPNGAGKSSIFEAIMFALFGTGIRYGGRNPYDYVNASSTDKEARIELLFERGGRVYKLIRVLDARKKNHWALLKDENANLTLASKADQVNSEIRKILGFSDDVFRRTVYLPQGEIDKFLKATRGEISETVLRVLYGDTIERISEKVKERLESVNREFAAIQERYKLLVADLLVENVYQYEKEKRDLEKHGEELEKRLNDLRERERVLSSTLQGVEEYTSRKRDLEELKRLRDVLQRRVEVEGKVKKARELLPAYQKILDLKDRMRQLEKRISEITNRKVELEGVLEQLKGHLSKTGRELSTLAEKLSVLEKSIEEKRKIVEMSRPLLEELSVLRDRLRGIDNQVRRLEEKLEKKKEELKERRRELESTERRLREVKKALEENEENFLKYLAHEVARRLREGDTCPVCGGTFKGELEAVTTIETEFYENLMREERNLEKKKEVLERALKDGEVELEEYEEELKERKGEREGVLGRLEELRRELNEIGYSPDLERNLKELEEERKRKQEELRKIEGEAARLEKEIAYISAELKETERNLSEVSVEREETLKHVFEEERNFSQALLGRGFSLEEFLELVEVKIEEDASSKLAEVNARIKHIESDLERLEGQIQELDFERLQRELEGVKKEIASLEEKRKSVMQKIGKMDQLIESIESKRKELPVLEEQLKRVDKQRKLLELAKNSFKKDEFPSFCTAKILGEILARTNRYLSVMMDGRFNLAFSEERGFVVLDNGIQRRAEGLSGGERALISIALAISFAEAIAGRLEAFFVDEGFSSLDSENKRKIAAVLKELEKLNKVIVFVTHDREFSEEFERRIRIVGGRKV